MVAVHWRMSTRAKSRHSAHSCESERALGDKATTRLRDLVRSSTLDFEFVACSCPPGTEGTRACNYGRRCGPLKANGRDVAAILISENLAVPICGQTRCPLPLNLGADELQPVTTPRGTILQAKSSRRVAAALQYFRRSQASNVAWRLELWLCDLL